MRDDGEVAYLRAKNIFVPEVAEIENILMLEEVVRAVASFCGKDEDRVFRSVKKSILGQFRHELRNQAMQHTRHRIKRLLERRVDGKFTNINAFESHLDNLGRELNPRGMYEKLCREFNRLVAMDNYAGILKVFNQKSMLPVSNVSELCGLNGSKEAYINRIIASTAPRQPRIATHTRRNRPLLRTPQPRQRQCSWHPESSGWQHARLKNNDYSEIKGVNISLRRPYSTRNPS